MLASPKPKTICGDLANPPHAIEPLCIQQRWLVWKWETNKQGKPTKVPYYSTDPNRHARSNDPASWGTHTAAVSCVLAGKAHGRGFVLTDSGYGAIDLDNCLDPSGDIAAWANDIIELAKRRGAYIERTPSGSGLRVIGKVTTAPMPDRNWAIPSQWECWREGAKVEIYRGESRYITVTGLQIGPCVGLPDITDILDDITESYDANKVVQATAHAQGNGAAPVDDIDHLVQHGTTEGERSEAFSRVVWSLAGQGLSQDEIEETLKQHPNGIAFKYDGRLRSEIDRCYGSGKGRKRRNPNRPRPRRRMIGMTRTVSI